MEAIEKEKEVENEEEEEEIDTGPIVPNKEFLNSNKLSLTTSSFLSILFIRIS